ncbi:MAG: sialidase family protein, partial [Nitrososphaera sp.]
MRAWLGFGMVIMLILAGFSAALQPAVATFDAWKNLSQTSTIASNLSPHKAEQVAVSGNNVYAVWEDGSSDIFFSKSTDNGAHFSAPVNISNDSDDSTEPQIAAVGNSVYVIWTIQLSPSGTQIAFNASHDGGKTFDGKFVLTGAANTALYPRIAATSSTVSV